MNKPDDSYLEAQLRGELGPKPDITRRVLNEVFPLQTAKARRITPQPAKFSWRPIAAAAAILIVTGVALLAVISVLPTKPQSTAAKSNASDFVPDQAENRPAIPENQPEQPPENTPYEPDTEQPETPYTAPEETVQRPDINPEQTPTVSPDTPEEPENVPPEVIEEKPDLPSETKPEPPREPTETPSQPESTVPERALICDQISPSREGTLQVQRNGHGDWLPFATGIKIRSGDRAKAKNYAEFVLKGGSLLRISGEVLFEINEQSLTLSIEDGAIYIDSTEVIMVAAHGVSAHVEGISVLEEKSRSLQVHCLQGTAGELTAGQYSRLTAKGFGRVSETDWLTVQRKFKFLKTTPARLLLRQTFDESPEKVFGGVVKDGQLVGESDNKDGVGFYFAEPLKHAAGDLARIRLRLAKACTVVIQFGTVPSGNYRMLRKNMKANEWIELEISMAYLQKNTDSTAPNRQTIWKFLQIHAEDTTVQITIDKLEIVHRPE
ncbi:MAG: hypothetical protein L3J82_01695 [Planctomycetes bacterium]|nr:hypothetical protein [Planctomycetota bacterium]